MPELAIGHVEALAIRPARGAAMEVIDRCALVPGQGIAQEPRQVSDKRQVTLLAKRQWDEVCDAMGVTPDMLPWTSRRANMLIDTAPLAGFGEDVLPLAPPAPHFPDRKPLAPGLDLTLSLVRLIGRRLRVGGALLEVTVETKPCSHIDFLTPGLRTALTPEGRGGVCCRVLEPGGVAVGDALVLCCGPTSAGRPRR